VAGRRGAVGKGDEVVREREREGGQEGPSHEVGDGGGVAFELDGGGVGGVVRADEGVG
jgi:hypothetical protein